jgi:hypothetical protein
VGGWVGGKKVSLRTTSQRSWDVVKSQRSWDVVKNKYRYVNRILTPRRIQLEGVLYNQCILGEKTDNFIGISETLVLSAVAGVIFALLSGMPCIITGVTAPLLLYDEALYKNCKENGIDFLSMRIWIGVWTVIIALLVSMFQGSLLVKYFTKFTKDIFAALVSFLYIFEPFRKLSIVFMTHPLASLNLYCGINQTLEDVTQIVSGL